jgi:hypothetical protein
MYDHICVVKFTALTLGFNQWIRDKNFENFIYFIERSPTLLIDTNV